jgi:hypothetical protein
VTSLVEALAEDLVRAVGDGEGGAPRRTLLWLDPDRGFERLWPLVEPELQARQVEPVVGGPSTAEQFEMKLQVLRAEGTGARVVAYLPGCPIDGLRPRRDGTAPDLWSVYEYRYKGRLWSLSAYEEGEVPEPPTLAAWLEHRGVQFRDDETRVELVDGGPDSLLARFADVRAGFPLDAWPRPLRASDVAEVLGGDPRDSLKELLASPRNAVRLWSSEADVVLGRIADTFGLDVSKRDDPEALADSVAVQLAMTEAWDAFGRAPDFPFRTRLPGGDEQRDRCIRFVTGDILMDRELGPRFRERMVRLEPTHDLAGWAKGREGHPKSLPLLARSRWRAFLDELSGQLESDWRTTAAFVLTKRAEIDAGRATPWDGLDGDTQWSVMADVAELADLATEAGRAVDVGIPVDEIVRRYVGDWWRMDDLHLRVRAVASQTGGLEAVRRLADLVYFTAVEALNLWLTQELEAVPAWPPAGLGAVVSLREQLWSAPKGRRAVVVVDALRLDLAQALADALQAELTAVASTLPSTTPFGMSALLPIDEVELAIQFDDSLRLNEMGGRNLVTRQGRKDFLSATLTTPAGKSIVGFADLDDLLRGDPVPDAKLVVVFDNTIDEQGHKGTEEFPAVSRQLVGKLRRVVELLHDADVTEVHVVTDHGFLLLPEDMVNGLGNPEVGAGQVYKKDLRWVALKPGAPVAGLLRLPLPLAPNAYELGFPHGTRTLMKSGDFVHGGISLQETVVPHIVSRAALGRTKIGVEVLVTTSSLSAGTVPLVVRPAFEGQAALGEVAPMTVHVWVEGETSGAEGARPVTDQLELEVRPDVDELKPPLYLLEGLGLKSGQPLTLHAVDGETGEDLASVPLTLQVDWD